MCKRRSGDHAWLRAQGCRGARPSTPSSSSSGAAAGAQTRLFDALAHFGDAELVAAGLHENFWRARYLDTHMARTAAILDALGATDCLIRAAHRRSDFGLLKFAPAHALAVRAIVAGPQRCALCPDVGGIFHDGPSRARPQRSIDHIAQATPGLLSWIREPCMFVSPAQPCKDSTHLTSCTQVPIG